MKLDRQSAPLLAGLGFLGFGAARYTDGAGYGAPNHVMGSIFMGFGVLLLGLFLWRLKDGPNG